MFTTLTYVIFNNLNLICFISNYFNGVFLSLYFIYFIEWCLLHIIYLYILSKILIEKNLFKSCILIIFFLIFTSIYLSKFQYELFACFLFISEFIIILFYYCFFLHSNYSVQGKHFNLNNNVSYKYILLLLLIVIIIYFYFSEFSLIPEFNDINYISKNIYSFYSNYFVTDLRSMYSFFFKYHILFFLLIGFMLTLLTFVILYFILNYFYFYINLKNSKQTNTLLKIPEMSVLYKNLNIYYLGKNINNKKKN